MKLQESAEMYLETIYTLSLSKQAVRSVDVAEALGYSRPSISRAVGLLKNDGYLAVSDDGFLELTEKGSAVAQKVFERHTILTSALMALGVARECAAEDACRIEHVISDQSLEAIKAHLEKYAQK
jgi:Mn-dependent DtxR family transcriptional regulator